MNPTADLSLVILAVADPAASAAFYRAAFGWLAAVEVPVYVELALPGGRGLGLYQREAFAANTGVVPSAAPAGGLSPAELYLRVDDLGAAVAALEAAGARTLSPAKPRPWGDEAAYFADPDGHVVVVARPLPGAAPVVTPFDEADRAWIAQRTQALFNGEVVISRGVAHRPAELAGFVATIDGDRAGLATWRPDGADAAELVTIDALAPGRGIGTALLGVVEAAVAAAGRRRLWLVTTNDNLDAQRFYYRRGYRLAAVHPGALAESRTLKPAIPLVGCFGIPMADELIFEKRL